MNDLRRGNAFYAQSGGVTSVINASASALLLAAREHPERISRVLAGRNGILGALEERLVDTSELSEEQIAALCNRPGGVFGSCRHKLRNISADNPECQRLLSVFQAYDIRYFFYNGGNDSADTCLKMAELARRMDYSLQAIHLPKTVDNDLALTDCCPGFGSAAKYIAVSVREAALDVASMAATSTRVFILEVMGRNAGWLAAAGALARDGDGSAPHIVLVPEAVFDKTRFVQRMQDLVQRCGYCVVVASEGIRDADGNLLSASERRDAFGHQQLGGVAPMLAKMASDAGLKSHWAVADYLQRSARHLASATDLEQARAVGTTAVKMAMDGHNAIMPAIVRTSDAPYKWHIEPVPLSHVANEERRLPANYIAADGMDVTASACDYLRPLIQGEAWPPYRAGLPLYETPPLREVSQRLPPFQRPPDAPA